MHNEKRQNLRLESSEYLPVLPPRAMSVWVPGLAAASVCCYQNPGRYPWSRMPTRAMLMSVGYVEVAPPLI